jgi:hypothetical protein
MGDLQKAYDDAAAAFERAGKQASNGEEKAGEENERTATEPVSSEATGNPTAEKQ